MARKRDTIVLFPSASSGSSDQRSVIEKNAEQQIHISNPQNIDIDISSGDALYLWNQICTIIKDNVSSQVYRTWFELIKPLSWSDLLLTVEVPSQFFVEWLEEHYNDLLRKSLNHVAGENSQLQYEVVVRKGDSSLEDRTIRLPAFKNTPASATQPALPFSGNTHAVISDSHEFLSSLNQRYVFENFIRGESNQLAASAAYAVAENPGKTRFNPLFIYGGTGLGKTHIAQAIGNHLLQKNPSAKVLYTNSERFTIEYVQAIQNNKVNEFTNYYRSIDVLIIDDIQFLGGKEKTQDHFFHTFNALHQAGKQLVLTSDKPPKDLLDLDARLISRFQWGLTSA